MEIRVRAQETKIKVNDAQRAAILRTFGACRYAYNWVIRLMDEAYKAHQEDPSKPLLTTYFQNWTPRWTKERPAWTRKTLRFAQDRAIRNACEAYNRLIHKAAHHPVQHKKLDTSSYYINGDRIKINGTRLTLPLIGEVEMTEPLRFKGKLQSVVVKQKHGELYVVMSVVCEDDMRPICAAPNKAVAMDVGFTHLAYAVDDDGVEYILNTPDSIKRTEEHLHTEIKRLATKREGSNNYKKQKARVQRLYSKLENQRSDLLDQFTTMLAKTHGILITEDLNIGGLVKKANKSLLRCFSRSCMGTLIDAGYKFQEHRRVDRFFASTQICSVCGSRESVTLKDRTFSCTSCGATLDRDKNAAINLLHAGRGTSGVLVSHGSKD